MKFIYCCLVIFLSFVPLALSVMMLLGGETDKTVIFSVLFNLVTFVFFYKLGKKKFGSHTKKVQKAQRVSEVNENSGNRKGRKEEKVNPNSSLF